MAVIVAAAAVVAGALAYSASRADFGILLNADLTKGSGNSPDQWRSEGWDQRPEVTLYSWSHPAHEVPELEIENRAPNDARWVQTLSLGPGWYVFEAEGRAESVGDRATGASISVMEDGIISKDLQGDSGWQKLKLYLKIGQRGADIEFAVRLGGYSSLNTGRAFFRHIKAELVAGPPPPGVPQFDLEAIRKQSAGAPIGKPWSLAATFAALALLAYFGWWQLGRSFEAQSRAEVEPRERPRKAARR